MFKKLLLGVSLVWLLVQSTGHATGLLAEIGAPAIRRVMSSVKPFSAAVVRPLQMAEYYAVPFVLFDTNSREKFTHSSERRHFSNASLERLDKSKKRSILSAIKTEIDKLPRTAEFHEIVDHTIQYIKDNNISKKAFQKEVAKNCANQWACSQNKSLKFCSDLYKSRFMDPENTAFVREEEGRAIRSIIGRCNFSSDFRIPASNIYVATLLD